MSPTVQPVPGIHTGREESKLMTGSSSPTVSLLLLKKGVVHFSRDAVVTASQQVCQTTCP